MTFSSPLRLDDLGNRTFMLVMPLTCTLDDGNIIEVPAGFITDFASVPQVFWNIIPPHGPYGKSAVIHDCLYQTSGFQGKYTRKEADQIFLRGMEVLGVPWLTRHTMYRAVRIWSWRYWKIVKSTLKRRAITGKDLTGDYILRSPMPILHEC